MHLFFLECKKFSKENWWVYAIFFLCFLLIYWTQSGNVFEIIIIFFLHWLGDIFMMMGESFAKNAYISQTISVSIFLVITLYGAVYLGKVNYLASQLLFMYPSLRAGALRYKKPLFPVWGYWVLTLCITYWLWNHNYVGEFSRGVQLLGFVLFPFTVCVYYCKLFPTYFLGKKT